MDISEKWEEIKLNILKHDRERQTLYEEKHLFEWGNFDKLYVGKFWKNKDQNAVYSYCKDSIEIGGQQLGIFDYFVTGMRMYPIKFKKDAKGGSINFCAEEITREEYENAFEDFKMEFFEFVRIDRKVLFEKFKRIVIIDNEDEI